MYKDFVQYLKSKSDYFPSIFMERNVKEDSFEEVHLSTIVRFERKHIWYNVHCIKTYIFSPKSDNIQGMQCVYQDFLNQIHMVQHLYTDDLSVVDSEGVPLLEKDRLQISEKSRLMKIFYSEHGKSKDNLYRYSYRNSE